MATNIEAKSLSDLNHIAANPPKYPRNPTESKRESLILHISRVPGTSDVILSTLRPQLKNVTAADVQNSLYYLHLDSGEEILAEARASIKSRSSASTERMIQRKPVAKSTASSVGTFEHPSCKAQDGFVPTATKLGEKAVCRKPLPDSSESCLDVLRKPLGIETSPEQSPTTSQEDTSPMFLPVSDNILTSQGLGDVMHDVSMTRRPLGPRPLVSEPEKRGEVVPGPKHRPLDFIPQVKDFALLSEAHAEISEPLPEAAVTHATHIAAAYTSPHTFSVTVIRRDPPSGLQWNVGKIIGSSNSNEKPTLTTKVIPLAKKIHDDISIHITNPAYNSFRASPVMAGLRRAKKATSQMNQGSSLIRGNGVVANEEKEVSIVGFTTNLHMEGTDFWGTTRQRARALSDLANTLGVSSGVPPDPASDIHTQDSAKRGYVFGSIWGGTCKFSTGASGRSLRCNHVIPSINTSADTGSVDGSVAVSDLRFNLPLSVDLSRQALVARSRNLQRIPDQIRHKFTSHDVTSQLPARPKSGSYDTTRSVAKDSQDAPTSPPRTCVRLEGSDSDEDDGPKPIRPVSFGEHVMPSDDEKHVSLGIGQERAGGGYHGKRAKLGKLIIHDEGFKMLDLIVAANMGVWWSVWDPDR